MTRQEFQRCFEVAQANDFNRDAVDADVLMGYGLPDFEPVAVTVETVADCMRWQALQFDGNWDQAELSEMQRLFRRRVTLLG